MMRYLTTIAALIFFSTETLGDYKMLVGLDWWKNPEGQELDGTCCDSIVTSSCECGFLCPDSVQCDTAFRICIEPMRGNNGDPETCSTGWFDTGIVKLDTDSFSFDTNHLYGNWFNPQYSVTFPGYYQDHYVKFLVRDVDDNDPDDVIARFTVPLSVSKYPLINTNYSVSFDVLRKRATTDTLGFHFEAIPCTNENPCNPVPTTTKGTPTTTAAPPTDCYDILAQFGSSTSGIYQITPPGFLPISVYCDMTTDGGGWTVFQQRVDGSLDFTTKGWKDFEIGFDNGMTRNYWLGLQAISVLSRKDKRVEMRVDLTDCNRQTFIAHYDTFQVGAASTNYTLNVAGYSGTAGDSLISANPSYTQNAMQFSTSDVDHDTFPAGNCVQYYLGAWWWNRCGYSNLNGKYYDGCSYEATYQNGIWWHSKWPQGYSPKTTQMKLRRAKVTDPATQQAL